MPEENSIIVALQAPGDAIALIKIDYDAYDTDKFSDAYLDAYAKWTETADDDDFENNEAFVDFVTAELKAAGFEFEAIDFCQCVITLEDDDDEDAED